MLDTLIDATDEALRVIENIARQFAPFDNPLIDYRPHGDAEVNAVFGDPTGGGKYMRGLADEEKPDPKWVKSNIVYCGPEGHLPPIHPMLAGYWWGVHRKAEPTMRELLRRIEVVAPGYITKKGGTWAYNPRRIRHDTLAKAKREKRSLRKLSRHTWGCAIDIEPGRNKSKTFKPGKTPKMWSKEWMAIWPDGITPAIYAVIKAMGLRCGIDWVGFVDPMHGEICGSRVQV